MHVVQHIPHAGQQLDKTAIAVSERYHKVGFANGTRSNVDERQDESRQCKGGQTQWSWVGKVALRGAADSLSSEPCDANLDQTYR
jgi:hypothetical protein